MTTVIVGRWGKNFAVRVPAADAANHTVQIDRMGADQHQLTFTPEAGTPQMPREKAGEPKAQRQPHESKHRGERKRVKDGAAGAHEGSSTVKPVCFSGSMVW